MKTTYYGQSTFMLEAGGKKLLFDPFISPNPAAKDIDIHSLKPDYILVSHGHGDHVADLLDIQKSSGAKVICIAEIAGWLGKHGVEDAHGMNIGGSWNFDFGTVKFTKAFHSSSYTTDDQEIIYTGMPSGILFTAEGKTIYHAGDTSLFGDMALIGKRHPIDIAFLPIGDNFTMDINDAIICADMVKCNRIIGVHYDTFPAIKINRQEAIDKFAKAGKELILINIGDSVEMETR